MRANVLADTALPHTRVLNEPVTLTPDMRRAIDAIDRVENAMAPIGQALTSDEETLINRVVTDLQTKHPIDNADLTHEQALDAQRENLRYWAQLVWENRARALCMHWGAELSTMQHKIELVKQVNMLRLARFAGPDSPEHTRMMVALGAMEAAFDDLDDPTGTLATRTHNYFGGWTKRPWLQVARYIADNY